MTNVSRENWYVYQPRGSVERQIYGERLWGIGGPVSETQIIGLTKAEATAVKNVLEAIRIGQEVHFSVNSKGRNHGS